MIADYLDEMEIENKALRALSYNAGFHEEMANRLKSMMRLDKSGDKEEIKEREVQYNKH